MIDIVKTLLLSLNKNKLEESDIILTTATLEMLLDEPKLGLQIICLIQLLLNQLELLKEEVEKDFVLKQRVAELRLKVLRLGIAQIDDFNDAPPRRVKNNIQISTPTRSLGMVKEINVFEYEDGTIEEHETYNIHPKIEADSDSPLLNDFAQYMMNKGK